MKKIFITLSLLFLLTANSVQAISIVNQSDSMIINGVSLYKSDIKNIQYFYCANGFDVYKISHHTALKDYNSKTYGVNVNEDLILVKKTINNRINTDN